jgi:hypothetical protein
MEIYTYICKLSHIVSHKRYRVGFPSFVPGKKYMPFFLTFTFTIPYESLVAAINSLVMLQKGVSLPCGDYFPFLVTIFYLIYFLEEK